MPFKPVSQVRVERAVAPADQLIGGANPEIALCVLGERIRGKNLQAIVTADASGVVTHNLAQSAAERRRDAEIARAYHPGSCCPDPLLVIFQDRADTAGDVLLEAAVLPTQKSTVS